jgi:hypothetical protein
VKFRLFEGHPGWRSATSAGRARGRTAGGSATSRGGIR